MYTPYFAPPHLRRPTAPVGCKIPCLAQQAPATSAERGCWPAPSGVLWASPPASRATVSTAPTAQSGVARRLASSLFFVSSFPSLSLASFSTPHTSRPSSFSLFPFPPLSPLTVSSSPSLVDAVLCPRSHPPLAAPRPPVLVVLRTALSDRSSARRTLPRSPSSWSPAAVALSARCCLCCPTKGAAVSASLRLCVSTFWLPPSRPLAVSVLPRKQ